MEFLRGKKIYAKNMLNEAVSEELKEGVWLKASQAFHVLFCKQCRRW